MDFFQVVPVPAARAQFLAALGGRLTDVEEVPLLQALGRVTAGPVAAAADLPGFDRSTVDGFAVRAQDTFGAQESLPACLRLVGEVRMGRAPAFRLNPAEAAPIATGGMLPAGADAVLMLEHSESLNAHEVGALRPVAPGENVIRRDEDARAGEPLLPGGRLVQPHDLGLLAAAGVTRLAVRRRPQVAVLSSGDEVVPPEQEPAPGQTRDANSYSLGGAVLACGGEPLLLGILPDRYEDVAEALRLAASRADLVLVSGGSSVGTRDVTARAIAGLGGPGILAHGVAVKPGKPTIIAVAGGTPVVGLPGHPVSALVVFQLLVRPVLRALLGLDPDAPDGPILSAELGRNLASAAGRLDVARVTLRHEGGRLVADPLLGKSGLLSTMVRADGWVEVPEAREGLRAGETVQVHLFPR
ncbi:MAG: gephyrin-like molybdotransferase Glp [Bacillota bacterium]